MYMIPSEKKSDGLCTSGGRYYWRTITEGIIVDTGWEQYHPVGLRTLVTLMIFWDVAHDVASSPGVRRVSVFESEMTRVREPAGRIRTSTGTTEAAESMQVGGEHMVVTASGRIKVAVHDTDPPDAARLPSHIFKRTSGLPGPSDAPAAACLDRVPKYNTGLFSGINIPVGPDLASPRVSMKAFMTHGGEASAVQGHASSPIPLPTLYWQRMWNFRYNTPK
ncbi:hypothetical protein B0H17DRAFT_1130556 [Mycena rosella]|uniref:Uncharacterized protein n=1 Tax=Mycena rosella TaxID=1033263 RepID=A0AAD7DTD6_MYCRO|nr:hypothetical protein B0H17DRAFT_1130556 [Mycena rosella]